MGAAANGSIGTGSEGDRTEIPQRIFVAGARMAGAASARALLRLGREVTVYDARRADALDELSDLGARIIVADRIDSAWFDAIDQVVVSPIFSPSHPLVTAVQERGLEIICEPELAWRLREPGAARWLAVTGTNGKTTTTTMLAHMMAEAGLRTAALGNIGEPLVDQVNGPYDVIAVELSSYQLHWSRLMAPAAGTVLNLAPDHLDWHGTFAAYTEAKSAVWRGGTAVFNLDDPAGAAAARRRGGNAVGFTLGEPEPGQFGVALGRLVDYTGGTPVPICAVDEVRPAGSHNVANALAAAALAATVGVGPEAAGAALRTYTPEPHRNVTIAAADGVSWVDDSKATNPHAAAAALDAYDTIVWVAGGQLKGVDVGDLVERFAGKLRAAILIGQDRAAVADALARHAPHLPVLALDGDDDTVMTDVVRHAAAHARPGDTVLLSPAAASFDMFTGYAHRGDAFAAAVRHHLGMGEPSERT
jgi:UDP-N-acetylmuramoylalanine--D-glutamate ligase